MNEKWFEIVNKSEKSAEINIYSDIGYFGVSADSFSRELKALGEVSDLIVNISSEGGSVFDGISIYNILKNHKAKKTVNINGFALSIASVIAMAGDTIRMAEDGFIMIHEPRVILFGGKASELKKRAAVLDQLKNSIVNIYQKRTGLNASDIEKLVDEETWLNADSAKEKGFIDEITEEVKAAASSRVFSYTKIPDEIKAGFRELPEHLAIDMKTNNSKKEKEMAEAEKTEMLNLFGKDKAAEYCFAGKDMNAAKTDFIAWQKSEIERLMSEATAKDAKIAELNGKLELKNQIPVVPPVSTGNQTTPLIATTKDTYQQIFARLTTGEKKMSAREATKHIITNHKAEYDAFMAEHQRKE
jgi:ATP-dependent protease ClpP protease subunit